MEIPKTTVAGATSNAQQLRRRMAPASAEGAADVLHLSGGAQALLALDPERNLRAPAAPPESMSDPELLRFYLNRREDLRSWTSRVAALDDPAARASLIAEMAEAHHDPLDLDIADREVADGPGGETWTALRNAMRKEQARDARAGRPAPDPSVLPRVMKSLGDRDLFAELGRGVRRKLGPEATNVEVARELGSHLPDLGFETAVNLADYFELGDHRPEPYDPVQTLLDAGFGGCGEWAYALREALVAAGVPQDDVTIHVAGLGGPKNHAAVGVRDEATGRDMMLDPWQYGSHRAGRLQGFESSWWNAGTDLGTWWAGQVAQGNPFLDKEE